MSSVKEEKLFKELGKRIASLRKEKGLTQAALGEKAGLDRVAIGYIEQGKRRATVTTLYRIAQSLDVSLESLVSGF